MLPAGNYFCYVVEQALKKTSKGQGFMRFGFEVVARVMPDGTRKDKEEDKAAPVGELIFWLTDKAFDNSLRDIAKIVGGEIRSFTQLDPRSPNALSALNREYELTLRYEEYQGKQQARWSLPRDMGKPLSESEIETLDARLKAKSAAASEPADLTGSDFPAVDIGDDDVPF